MFILNRPQQNYNAVRNEVILAKMVVLTILGHFGPARLPTVLQPLLIAVARQTHTCNFPVVKDFHKSRLQTSARALKRALRELLKINVCVSSFLGFGSENLQWHNYWAALLNFESSLLFPLAEGRIEKTLGWGGRGNC